jgi:hypothetical protein
MHPPPPPAMPAGFTAAAAARWGRYYVCAELLLYKKLTLKANSFYLLKIPFN